MPSYASRSATKLYRTTPLRALSLRGPYFHNGVAATLEAVVELYNVRKGLNLTARQKADLVQYLRSALAAQSGKRVGQDFNSPGRGPPARKRARAAGRWRAAPST